MILESIYEGQFESSSHGFRPNKSCHSALTQIQKTYTGVKWFIEGDIKSFFDNINHVCDNSNSTEKELRMSVSYA